MSQGEMSVSRPKPTLTRLISAQLKPPGARRPVEPGLADADEGEHHPGDLEPEAPGHGGHGGDGDHDQRAEEGADQKGVVLGRLAGQGEAVGLNLAARQAVGHEAGNPGAAVGLGLQEGADDHVAVLEPVEVDGGDHALVQLLPTDGAGLARGLVRQAAPEPVKAIPEVRRAGQARRERALDPLPVSGLDGGVEVPRRLVRRRVHRRAAAGGHEEQGDERDPDPHGASLARPAKLTNL
ncbi:hypothetical protein [Phenylobacterium sp. J367]|uniref:hypothetical protein n=1 Tax=Phenylobacterium sp. J367 TaxID=2898435 RepID=UPI0021519285|nr:hypothetical protein [Phenylobacterium sp. J367]MCR5880358.1 hypothetical protein [Phenylobacterium sp. J367]